MKKRFFYNVFLNIGIIVLLFLGVSAYKGQQYLLVVTVALFIVLLAFLKYRLLKQVKASIDERSKSSQS